MGERGSAKIRLAQNTYVQRTLGGKVICDRCGATLDNYADVCSAALGDPCPGFRAIDDAKTDFWRLSNA